VNRGDVSLRFLLLLLIAFSIIVTASNCGGGSSGPPPATLGVPTNVPSTLVLALIPQAIVTGTTPTNHNPLITVLVGGTNIPLLFDTGSSGLRIFATALPSTAYTSYANKPVSVTLGTYGAANQITYVGNVGTADVQIGGVDLGTQPFQLVTQVVGSTVANEMATKGTGVFGVAPTVPDVNGIGSLMGRFPGALSSGFVVSLYGNQVTVGITSRQGFSLYPVPVATPASVPSGISIGKASYWSTIGFNWCYAVTIPSMAPSISACLQNTVTETGGQNSHLYFTGIPPPSPSGGSTATPIPTGTLVALPPGSGVTAILSDSSGNPIFSWQAPTAGTCSAYDVIDVWFGPSTGIGTDSNGIDPYYSNDVMYDLAQSNFGLRTAPASAFPPSFCPPGS